MNNARAKEVRIQTNLRRRKVRDFLGMTLRFTQVPRFAELGIYVSANANRLLRRRREYVLLACMPKTGSTYIKKTVAHLTGFREAVLLYAAERSEQDLYLPKVIDWYPYNTVTQQHVRATDANLSIMNRYEIRPVILVRNLADIVVSIRDHLLAEGFERFPSLYATEHFGELGEDEQFQFLVTYALPWYFEFYVSWYDAHAAGRIDPLWLSYEELSHDWASGIKRILEFYGIAKSDAEIESALAQINGLGVQEIRFNKGVVGRGSRLNSNHRREIERMASFYPWVDFGRVGLPGGNLTTGDTLGSSRA